jgi:SAM-dependent methyltransferase
LRVLDVGGRLQPYRPLLNDRVREYYSVDIVSGSFVNAVGTAEELPFASCQFDLVFCTQMLEYVPRPQQAVDEIYRVLRPGGYLLLSAPAVFPRDSEVEYWRFLPSALRLLLRDFSELEIAPEGSTITGLLRTINVSLIAFSPRPARTIFKYTVVPVLNVIAVLLDKTVHSRNDQLTANFSAFARK